MRRKLSGAFTLIELLLVIAIISILAALLFPVFQSAKRASHGTDCIASLHNLGVAIDLYTIDNDQMYPWGVDGFQQTSPLTADAERDAAIRALPRLDSVLASYVRAPDVWACDLDDGKIGKKPPLGRSVAARFGSSYWYQTALALDHVSSPPSGRAGEETGMPERGPAEIIVLRDWSPFWHLPDGMVANPTNERYQALYADGHTKGIGIAEQTRGQDVSF